MPILDPFDSLALSVHQNPGVYAVLVGSGLSRAAGIPTGWEITLSLIERLGAVRGAGAQQDWAKWYRDTYKEEPNYSDILDALASTPAERRNILHSYIEPKVGDETRRTTKAHRAIARLVADGYVRVVITSNFDRLLEIALREVGVEPTLIASEDAIVGSTPLIHSRCTLIKVHGDYLDTRIRNTQSELSAYPAALNSLLAEVFDRFGLIVVGWSGEWDLALRDAIVRAPSRRYPFYWVTRGRIAQLAQDLIDHRHGSIVPATDADAFFGRLADAIVALKDAERPHPQSAEMAVALAKRYCREDRFALEWSELLAGEVAKIRTIIGAADYAKLPLDVGVKPALVLLANCSETLRRACMVCGRWGSIENRRIAIRVVRSLVTSGTLSGLVAWSDIRDIPASLCFYWFLTGALHAENFESIRILMHQPVRRDNEEVLLVERLPLNELSPDIWRRLGEFGKFAWSNWMFSLMEKESADIALANADASSLFDELELLIAVEHAVKRLQRIELEKKGFFSFPLGRYVSDSGRQSVFDRLSAFERLPPDHPLFIAGLLGGDLAKASPALSEIRKLLGEHPGLRWP